MIFTSQGEKKEDAKKQDHSSESKSEKSSKKEQPAKDEDANCNNFNETKQHCDKSIDVKKEVQEMWKGIREDTGMTEQQLCESLTKMADLVGHDLQSF